MICEVLPDAWEVHEGLDTQCTKFCAVADTGIHQDLCRANAAGREDDLFLGVQHSPFRVCIGQAPENEDKEVGAENAYLPGVPLVVEVNSMVLNVSFEFSEGRTRVMYVLSRTCKFFRFR